MILFLSTVQDNKISLLGQSNTKKIFWISFESLKEKDRVVGKYLEQANEMLPLDKRFSFYIVKFTREVHDFGQHNGKNANHSSIKDKKELFYNL